MLKAPMKSVEADGTPSELPRVETKTIKEINIGDFKAPLEFTRGPSSVLSLDSFQIFAKEDYGERSALYDQRSATISGLMNPDKAKINHAEVHPYLRDQGVGRKLLSELERELAQRGVRSVYSTFFNPRTVGFFLKNGYTIIPFGSISDDEKNQLDMDPSDYDMRVGSFEDFQNLRKGDELVFRKILMKKELKPEESEENK